MRHLTSAPWLVGKYMTSVCTFWNRAKLVGYCRLLSLPARSGSVHSCTGSKSSAFCAAHAAGTRHAQLPAERWAARGAKKGAHVEVDVVSVEEDLEVGRVGVGLDGADNRD